MTVRGKKQKNEATTVASARVKSWAIVLELERPDGTLYTETKADIPSRVSDEIDEYITELEDEDKKHKYTEVSIEEIKQDPNLNLSPEYWIKKKENEKS